jgi:hypothetical protein
MVNQTLPNLAVCSYNEIVSGIGVQTIGASARERQDDQRQRICP